MAEQRLIDANTLKKEFDETLNIKWYYPGIHATIDNAPTIDAVPVVHGHWEWFEDWYKSTTEHPAECQDAGWRCSHCKATLAEEVGGYWDDIYDAPIVRYCPACGAKMDDVQL